MNYCNMFVYSFNYRGSQTIILTEMSIRDIERELRSFIKKFNLRGDSLGYCLMQWARSEPTVYGPIKTYILDKNLTQDSDIGTGIGDAF